MFEPWQLAATAPRTSVLLTAILSGAVGTDPVTIAIVSALLVGAFNTL